MSLLVRDLVKMGETQLKKVKCPDPKKDAEVLYCYMRNIDRNQFIMEWSEIVDDRICDKYFDLIAERSTRRPLQHITGIQNIMGLDFGIREDVLIPRMDTETLIEKTEEIIKQKGKASVLDLCCGSGAVGISLAVRNKGVKLTMADISSAAKALAEANAKKFGIKTDV
ncbi:MAG TPA: methyltransferase, partial [Bacillota bacterium]|nr:methyltransferase [Bacillota bacterium]